MISLTGRYKFVSSLLLVTIIIISFLAKDLHEIFVKHQYVVCFDHDDDSYSHYHTTKHTADNCLICSFVLAPALDINLESAGFIASTNHISYNSYYTKVYYNSTLHYYPLRGPPDLG